MSRMILLTVLVNLAVFVAAKNDYKGYKIHRLLPETAEQLDLLNNINEDAMAKQMGDKVEFWTDTGKLSPLRGEPVMVMVSPDQEHSFLRLIDQAHIRHNVTVSDLAALLGEESRMGPEDLKAVAEGTMTWTAYHRYATIENFLERLATDYPDLVTKETLGHSYEGRSLYLLTLGKKRADGKTKPAIWMDAQIHAREWIASAVMTYMMNKMLSEYGKDPTSTRMLDEIDWIILPVINVDGFEYTKTDVRLNRLTRAINPFSTRAGTDPNRNYDHKWMLDGASQTPGSETYAGPYPLSEIENVILTDAALKHRKQIKTFLTFHSYSQMWLYGWGYDTSLPADYRDLHDMGVKATAALEKKYGTKYRTGSSTGLLGAAAGATDDWGKAKAMVKYSFTVELRDTGRYMFVLPPDQIEPSGIETFEAINVVAQIVMQEFGPTLD